jgi:HSP20 family protein
MNLVRWDPFRELEGLQARLNRVFSDLPTRPKDEAIFSDWAPAVDVQETDTEYMVKADLPEVKKEDVKVEVSEGVLTIEGERTQEKEEKGRKFHRVEREYGKFVRRFSLPTEVNAEAVKAEFKDGVLNVHLPKMADVKPKTVAVKVA